MSSLRTEIEANQFILETLKEIPLKWQKILLTGPFYDYTRCALAELKKRYIDNESITPQPKLIFECLGRIAPSDIKVVIIGQDPYINPNEAMGLSFSVPSGVKIPPSLNNIFAALKASNINIEDTTSGDLTSWTHCGVLLLNACLTTKLHTSNAHMFWEKFTDKLVQYISTDDEPKVFILWGAFAQKKEKLIASKNKHTILKWSHPSPLANNRLPIEKKFDKCDHFIRTNKALLKNSRSPINWCIGNDLRKITLFTDGSARANGKANAIASYAYYIPELMQEHGGIVKKILCKGKPVLPSNQRGELMGIIKGLKYLLLISFAGSCQIVSDSMYCINIINTWLTKWKKENTLSEKKNLDLIETLDKYIIMFPGCLTTKHVKSHITKPLMDDSTNKAEFDSAMAFWLGNDKVDKIAQGINNSR
ncbi:MAG: uracil-DNA glycosylase [Candidatus Aenigmarchaeota archaeon]|nr:uracil-DNA glycosylase [Candidatus Aenigmarchaeota archaeon]